MGTFQISWAPDNRTLRTFGRPDVVTAPPPSAPKFDSIVAASGAATVVTGPPASTFTHPGVVLGAQQLEFVKAKLAASAEPWTSEYNKMTADACGTSGANWPLSANTGRLYSSLSWVPTPWDTVSVGASGQSSHGDQDEIADLQAAYCHALIWYYKGTRANAQMAIRIMNAWATTIQTHLFSTDPTLSNGRLQTGWAGSLFSRAAEIMRYSFTPSGTEEALNVAAIIAAFDRAYIPLVRYGWTGGGCNWHTSMSGAHLGMSIFSENKPEFDRALVNHRNWVKSYAYMDGDVNQWPQLRGYPISLRLLPDSGVCIYDKSTTTAAQMNSYWYLPTTEPASTYTSGMWNESGRDPIHVAMGISGLSTICETARLQGVDLYGEESLRIRTTVERNAGWLIDVYVNQPNVRPPTTYSPYPYAYSGWGGPNHAARNSYITHWNHFVNRLGFTMPLLSQLISDYVMPATINNTSNTHVRNDHDYPWDPLVMYGTP
jgi:hypothetical protein